MATPPDEKPAQLNQLTAAQMNQLQQFADRLGQLDYFQILRIDQTAIPADIKKAFHRESRTFHPDRFFHLSDTNTKSNINQIYKRITEAYYVLRDDQKRKKYLVDITGPSRLERLRFSESSEVEQKLEAKKAADEEFGGNPKSRQFYKAALTDIERENWAAAERNVKMALTFEPANQKFKDKLVEIAQKLEEIRRGPGSAS